MLSRTAITGRYFLKKNLNKELFQTLGELVVDLGSFVKLTRFVHIAQPLVCSLINLASKNRSDTHNWYTFVLH